jgi:hypothetical protein
MVTTRLSALSTTRQSELRNNTKTLSHHFYTALHERAILLIVVLNPT